VVFDKRLLSRVFVLTLERVIKMSIYLYNIKKPSEGQTVFS